MIDLARQENRKGLVLTCKDRLVPYYSKFGFKNEGVSSSCLLYTSYSAINQENIIMWVLFLCSGILSLSSNISRNNKKEDE